MESLQMVGGGTSCVALMCALPSLVHPVCQCQHPGSDQCAIKHGCPAVLLDSHPIDHMKFHQVKDTRLAGRTGCRWDRHDAHAPEAITPTLLMTQIESMAE
jgi:hypothetical protein